MEAVRITIGSALSVCLVRNFTSKINVLNKKHISHLSLVVVGLTG